MADEVLDVYAKWDQVRQRLELAPPGSRVVLQLGDVPHPRDAGARKDLGLPVGQLADWRFPPATDCSGVHVHEHPDRWEAHLDRVHPACSLAGHVQHDVPQLLVAGGVAVGMLLGARSVGGVLGVALGAALGGIAGTMLTR